MNNPQSLISSKNDIHYVYSYNRLGYLISSRDLIHNTQTSRIVDPHGNILQETLANGYILKSEYDSQGRRTFLTLPNNKTISYSYQGPYLNTLSCDNLSFTYTYDHEGNLIDNTLTTLTYNPLSRPENLESPHFSEQCTFDPRGNITSIQSTQQLKEFTYDDHDHLTQEPNQTYTYDSLHNRISKNNAPYNLNSLNQIQSPDLEYDPNGNLIRSGDTYFTYDSLDRLIEVKTPTQSFTYSYDSEHRRLSKNNTLYIWDGNHELGTLNEYRILGPTPHAEIASAIALYINNEPHLPIHDLQGNLIQLLTPSKDLALEQTFTAFGEGQNTLSWGFSSKRHDPETGLIYFGRRFYDPHLGRFITTDPEGYTDTANLYTYCQNNPLTHHDPYGLFAYPPNLQLVPRYTEKPEFDPNWKEVGTALYHASLSYACDTALSAGKYLGGYYGPEDMSFADIYSAHIQANEHLIKTTDNWMANSPYAGSGLYHITRRATYTGIDFSTGFLFPFAGMKTAASAGKAVLKAEKIAHASPTLLKTNLVTGKVFKSSKYSSHYKEAVRPIWTSTKRRSSVKNAYQHWKDHGCEFSSIKNSKQYVEAANHFIQNPPSGTLTKIRPNGDVVFYHPASNTFAIKNQQGVLRTMYKPNPSIHECPTNLEYFYGQ